MERIYTYIYFGSQVYLEVLPMDVKEWVEVTGYKIYPFAPEQAGEIDLNSLKPNILSINRSLQNIVGEAVGPSSSRNTGWQYRSNEQYAIEPVYAGKRNG